jgi:hypothetical protein
MATLEIVTEIFDLLVRSKPAARVDDVPRTIQAWAFFLQDLPDAELWQAAVILGRTPGAFLPDVGTLADLALDLVDDQPPAEDAWALVVRYARYASQPENPVTLTERAANVLDTMGNCGDWTVDDLPFRKREFMDLYDKQRARWKRERALALPAGDVGGRLLSG